MSNYSPYDPEHELSFTSEHRTFAEKEGYRVASTANGYIIVMPCRPRAGEKTQTFKNLSMAWEVAAIRAGRKIVKVARETRPAPVMQSRYRGPRL